MKILNKVIKNIQKRNYNTLNNNLIEKSAIIGKKYNKNIIKNLINYDNNYNSNNYDYNILIEKYYKDESENYNNVLLQNNIKIGTNNYIGNNVKIYENVIIGNNNKIFDNCIIYPNTVMGNDNIFLRDNFIGEIPIQSSDEYDYEMEGINIGNNNLFHINNIIFSGIKYKTIIGNNNKILGEIHIGHDVEIKNNVHIYPRVIIAGFVKLLDYCGIGMSAKIHQNLTIGQYSFIGSGNFVSKNVFPFYININNKPRRLNIKKIDDNNILEYNDILLEIYNKYIDKSLNLKDYKNELPEKYFKHILDFIDS